jgi:hypothetical protein
MGILREQATGKTLPLEPEHVVGRALTCALRLVPRYVSAQQSLLRWAGESWYVRDLGSSNGTFLNGVLVPPGEEQLVRKGSRVAFGDLRAEWELVDDSPPQVMAIPLDDGAPFVMEGELLPLPSAEDPHGTIYRNSAGAWVLEQIDESIVPLNHFAVFQCAGRTWRFCCGQSMGRTTRAALSPLDMQVRHLSLEFNVSLNEEHVAVIVRCGGRTLDIGERAYYYLLLTLARRRVADAELGLPETSCGWVDREDLATDARMVSPQLNVDVFRIRKQFADKGIVDAASVVERRPGELRIGTGKITITRL